MPFDGTFSENQVTSLLTTGRARIAAGWCKNSSHKRVLSLTGLRDQYCIIGALPKYNAEAMLMLHRAMHSLGYNDYVNTPCFNDDPCTTKEQVLAVYDRAIELSLE